uniref:Chemosensory protein 2 n=1 Tax=Tomicus yunnanensis TaxID=768153 RepID=A0A4P2HMH9_9CUCU|nr:chemosensory protein 2 [Tomicus yunnanensis]
MKFAVVSFLFVVVVGVAYGEEYTSKFDNVDLDQILQSDRLLRNYINCLLEKGKCTPDGAELKKNLPDALENECAKCSPKQRDGAKKVIHFIIENKRSYWDELAAKYDPEGTYYKKYQAEAKKENINL